MRPINNSNMKYLTHKNRYKVFRNKKSNPSNYSKYITVKMKKIYRAATHHSKN
jgi:hypothetical protein